MSITHQNTKGWVLDACSLIDSGYSRCIKPIKDPKSFFTYHFKRRCFRISKSYFGANSNGTESGSNSETMPKLLCKPPKKRKRKHSELNQGEIDSRTYHEKNRSVILEGAKSLVDAVKAHGLLNEAAYEADEPLPYEDCRLAALCNMAKDLPLLEDADLEDQVQWISAEDGCTSHLDLFSRITENNSDLAVEVTLMGEQYVIPPHTAFLLSDFSRIQSLVHSGRRFDLIVMDPPWENKSVKRSGRYSSLPSSQLRYLPIPLLASQSCLIVTWVTNRPSHLRFVRDELYPHWGVEVLAEWFWVKVTRTGEFVYPLDSQHKKPYEMLILGRFHSSAENSQSSPEKSLAPVDDQRVIVSVPSALHSHKPSLSEVLVPYVGAEAKCLELFARSLQPGWTSWGNEVLKFQHTSYFTATPTDDPADTPSVEATSRHPEAAVIPASKSSLPSSAADE